MNFLQLISLIPFLIGTTTGFAPTAETNAQINERTVVQNVASAPALRGIYLTSQTVASPAGDRLLDAFKAVGGNMVVFDIQSSGGQLAYLSGLQTSIAIGNQKTQIADLPELMRKLHDKGFYAVARFVVFKNAFLAGKKPEWVLKRKGSNSRFSGRDGPVWLDVGNSDLQGYLIEIIKEIAAAGVDEIQLDYVRFPEAGAGGYIGYSYTGETSRTREQTITNFIADAAWELNWYGVKLSVDMFGIVVWDSISGRLIGQNVREISKYVDAIYPMPYPSHFGRGWGGHANPADEPYFFVQETAKKFLEQRAPESTTEIRPWLQGFVMRVSDFGPNYIREQIRALSDIGLGSFSVWNAANNYSMTLRAMESF